MPAKGGCGEQQRRCGRANKSTLLIVIGSSPSFVSHLTTLPNYQTRGRILVPRTHTFCSMAVELTNKTLSNTHTTLILLVCSKSIHPLPLYLSTKLTVQHVNEIVQQHVPGERVAQVTGVTGFWDELQRKFKLTVTSTGTLTKCPPVLETTSECWKEVCWPPCRWPCPTPRGLSAWAPSPWSTRRRCRRTRRTGPRPPSRTFDL